VRSYAKEVYIALDAKSKQYYSLESSREKVILQVHNYYVNPKLRESSRVEVIRISCEENHNKSLKQEAILWDEECFLRHTLTC
jgi:hypothetical protein